MNFGTADLKPAGQRQANQASETEPLLASVDGQVARLSAEEVVFHDPRTGDNHVMTMDVLTAMDAVRKFQPMAAHVEAITQRLPALKGKSHAVEKVFEFLRSRQLVVEARELLDQLRQTPAQDVSPPAGMVIRTCDRPAELERLVGSLAAYEQRSGRGLRYLVVDDSRRRAADNANALSALTDQGLEVHHLDREWRQRVVKRLPDPALSAQILGLEDPSSLTCGGAWNTALLLTAGDRFLMLDDDFVLDPRLPEGAASSVLSVREPAHVPMQFSGRNMADLAASLVSPGDVMDPLEEHLAACGQVPGILFGDQLGLSVSPATLRGASFAQVQSLLDGQAVKTTAAGAWGDWRMDTNLWLFLAPGAHTQGMRVDEATYRALSYQPVLAHGFATPQLTRMTNFTPLSFDNRELMPCTAATGRGEDFAFAAWLRFLYPDALCAHFPTMLRHQRPEASRESPLAEAYVPWLSRFAGEYALSRIEQCTAQGPVDRLQFLQALLRDLAAASAGQQQVVLGQFLAMLRSQIIEQAQISLTQMGEAADFWVRDAREWITENGRSLTQSGPPRLRDWPADSSAADCSRQLGEGLNRYADHLHHWQTLWQQCEGERESLLKT